MSVIQVFCESLILLTPTGSWMSLCTSFYLQKKKTSVGMRACWTQPKARYSRCITAEWWQNLTSLSISVNGRNRQLCSRRPQSPWLIHDVGGSKQEQTQAFWLSLLLFVPVAFLFLFFASFTLHLSFLSSRRWVNTTLLIIWRELSIRAGVEEGDEDT